MGQLIQVDRPVFNLEDVLETLFVGQPLNQSQLATLEARLRRSALAGVLTLLPATGRLHPAGAVAAAKPAIGLALWRVQLVQFHAFSFSVLAAAVRVRRGLASPSAAFGLAGALAAARLGFSPPSAGAAARAVVLRTAGFASALASSAALGAPAAGATAVEIGRASCK